jgi:hypothetical protein
MCCSLMEGGCNVIVMLWVVFVIKEVDDDRGTKGVTHNATRTSTCASQDRNMSFLTNQRATHKTVNNITESARTLEEEERRKEGYRRNINGLPSESWEKPLQVMISSGLSVMNDGLNVAPIEVQ